MTEVLSKAKRIDTGEWVEGYLIASNNRYFIVPTYGVHCIEAPKYKEMKKNINSYVYEVDSETVCRYTGLKDKNLKMIFERDIVKIPHRRDFGLVQYECPECQYVYQMQGDGDWIEMGEYGNEVEVLGNILDNPELLYWGR